jgi:hypothetical protein
MTVGWIEATSMRDISDEENRAQDWRKPGANLPGRYRKFHGSGTNLIYCVRSTGYQPLSAETTRELAAQQVVPDNLTVIRSRGPLVVQVRDPRHEITLGQNRVVGIVLHCVRDVPEAVVAIGKKVDQVG